MKVRIYPHNPASEGARDLAIAMKAKRIKHEGSKFNGGGVVINWGSSRMPTWRDTRIMNPPEKVAVASCKTTAFQAMRTARCVPFTTNRDEAVAWQNDGATVVCRALTRASGAEGMTLCEPGVDIPTVPLYTKYVPKMDEYRVHVFGGEVILVQRKALKEGVQNPNWKVRNLENGFIFQRNNLEPPADVLTQALAAINDLGLDFGAVDVIWNDRRQEAYVLEVNTAPGLGGSTVDDYANAFKKAIGA